MNGNEDMLLRRDEDYFSTDHLKPELRTRALRGASVTILAQGITFAIQTIGTIILARLLSPHDFGLVTMVLTVGMLLGNFGVNGFTEAVIQKEKLNHEQISNIFWINVGISILLALLFIASSSIIIWFYKEPSLQHIIIAIAASNIISGLSVQHIALMKRKMQFRKTALNDVIAASIGIVIPIILALQGWGYWALVVKWVTLPLATTIGAWVLCRWRPGLPSKVAGVGPLLHYALHTYGNFVMNYFRRNLDKMIIGRLFGSQPLGSYDRAYQLSNMLPTQVMGPLSSVAISVFSRLSDDPVRYQQHYMKMLSILAFIGMPLSAVLTLISNDVIYVLLGPRWNEAGPILCAFGPSIGITMLYVTHGWLHLSLGTPGRWFRWSIVEFIATVFCLGLGLPFGSTGVATAFTASFYVLIGPALWYAGKPIDLKLSTVLLAVWKPSVAAVGAGVLCWIILNQTGALSNSVTNLSAVTRISAVVIIVIFVYLVLIVAMHRSMRPLSQFVIFMQELRRVRYQAK